MIIGVTTRAQGCRCIRRIPACFRNACSLSHAACCTVLSAVNASLHSRQNKTMLLSTPSTSFWLCCSRALSVRRATASTRRTTSATVPPSRQRRLCHSWLMVFAPLVHELGHAGRVPFTLGVHWPYSTAARCPLPAACPLAAVDARWRFSHRISAATTNQMVGRPPAPISRTPQ